MTNIVIQRPYRKGFSPTKAQLLQFAELALPKKQKLEITIRIVSLEEMQTLNRHYRNKDKPTNVLSFRLETPVLLEYGFKPIGDLVICADIVNEEAALNQIEPIAHWAHIVIHGILHLLGHDHEEEHDTKIMQDFEIRYLKKLGFSNPYIGKENE